MRCLVVGAGAREHALVQALLQSPHVSEVLAAPGNPGMAAEPRCRCLPLSLDDLDGLRALALDEAVDLTVVGPEAPLAAGLADHLAEAGLRVLGPSAAAARLETSKAFGKSVLRAAGVPTATASVHTALGGALSALGPGPIVIKADGLAAGKGAFVCADRPEAEQVLRALLVERRLGEAGATVLLEERLSGPEVSVIGISDGRRVLGLPVARDYKRLLDGDLGPNTGGMGAVAPVEAPEGLAERLLQPVVDEMARRGTPFRGFLYAGVMLTARGPVVLELNVRLGDPEAQVILPLLTDDLFELLRDAADGHVAAARLGVRSGAAVCVVLAARGYPLGGSGETPVELDAGALEACAPTVQVHHAGTRRAGDRLLAGGGRVVSLTARAPTTAQARAATQTAAARLSWPGCQWRTDIGAE